MLAGPSPGVTSILKPVKAGSWVPARAPHGLKLTHFLQPHIFAVLNPARSPPVPSGLVLHNLGGPGCCLCSPPRWRTPGCTHFFFIIIFSLIVLLTHSQPVVYSQALRYPVSIPTRDLTPLVSCRNMWKQ